MVAVVVVCRRVQVRLILPTASLLRGWLGGYRRGLLATVDGITRRTALIAWSSIFSYPEKKSLSSVLAIVFGYLYIN